MTASGCSRRDRLGGTGASSLTSTPARANSCSRFVTSPPNSARSGNSCARQHLAAQPRPASWSVTRWPRAAAVSAAFMPAGPPPATRMRRGAADFAMLPSWRSRPVTGFWMQEMPKPMW